MEWRADADPGITEHVASESPKKLFLLPPCGQAAQRVPLPSSTPCRTPPPLPRQATGVA